MNEGLRSAGLGLAIGIVLVTGAGAMSNGAPRTDLETRHARPGRLIVKYRPTLDACVDCLLARGVPFRSLTGTDSLDELHRRLGVRGARPLFQPAAADSRRAAARQRTEAVRTRFAQRAARAPRGAAVPDLSHVFVLELPAGADLERAAADYAADPDVEYAQPDYQVDAVLTPDDPFFSTSGTWGQPYADLWGLQITTAATAWDTAIGANVVVAVVDTGVDHTHPDLSANMWVNPGEVAGNGVDDDMNGFVDDVRGWDFVQNDNTPGDLHGHGTHVAGTIAATGNNGVGVVGMAWGARVMAVRGLDANGSGYDSDLAAAIVYAAENGADVINNSWGGAGSSSVLADAVETAVGLGAVVVAAAGNSGGSVDFFSPASVPGVIAVGATTATDDIAGFSNHGNALSVSAPGVDVLSLRGATSGPVGGSVVGTDYLRLSGTSMASPHVAGLAAVLLSAQPALTTDEVRWHLELNADQPGYPGYEGQPWNPYFGFGRIDAGRVFDPVPVTTRLHGYDMMVHAFSGDLLANVVSADLSFTTHDPVAWTASTPPWLPPTVANGSGPATLGFSLDTAGLGAGTQSGPITVDAPAATDGGASLSATVHVHTDHRVGGQILVGETYRDSTTGSQVPVAGDGLGVFVVWSDLGGGLYAARIDADGSVAGPWTLHSAFPHKSQLALSFDGANFLVLWQERRETSSSPYRATVSVKALRVTPEGEVLDAEPLLIEQRSDRGSLGIYPTGVGYDGDAHTVVWSQFSYTNSRGKVYLRRVGADGTLRSRRRKIYPSPATLATPVSYAIRPLIACGTGTCLMAWRVRDGETFLGAYVDKTYGVLLSADGVLSTAPVRLLNDTDLLTNLISDGTGYALLAERSLVCPGPVICAMTSVVARVTGGGAPVDLDGIRVDTGDGEHTGYPKGTGLAFDGTNWIATFMGGGSRKGNQVFANRISPAGAVIDSEFEGLLVASQGAGSPTATIRSSVVSTPTCAIVVWADTIFDPPPAFSWRNQVVAQRMLPRTSNLPHATIGAIGPRTLAERTALALTLEALGLDPQATAMSASNLPAGARFDPATRSFRWMPGADQRGVYSGIHFEATDGVQTVSEDVTITVTEANLSLAGTLLANGLPAAGIALQLRGPAVKWTGFTDAQGRYRFEDLTPGRYTIRMTRPSTKDYRMTPASATVDVGSVDVVGVDFTVTPK